MPGEDPEFPFDVSLMLKQFKDNIVITKDEEGVIITFKNVAPGTDLRAVRQMMENMMAGRNNEMMRRFMGAFTGEPVDEDDDDAYDDGDYDELDEDEEFDEDSGPGFRIDELDDGKGFKMVPGDPDDIDDLHESMTRMFDPEFFENMMRALYQLLGVRPPAFVDPAALPGKDGEGDTSKDRKRKGGESNTTADYFYI